MVRIRRKVALIISVAVLSVFLLLYIIIDHSISGEKPDLKYIESKLKRLENGLYNHRVEVDAIQKQINSIKSVNSKEVGENSLNVKEMQKESVIIANMPFRGENQMSCPLLPGAVPKPDIQMLSLYNEIKFDNVDSTPWKQGWKIEYNEHDWNAHHKLKVFVVPHSHNDPGWIKTFDEYYEQTTKGILNNMLRHMTENENMKFIWAEISYFAKWFDRLSDDSKHSVRNLIKRKQLEIVTGGWVMPDEANSHWISLIQQLSEGQTWCKHNLNVTPSTSWAIDPFGESPVVPFILKASGFDNLLIQRTHYEVKKRLAQQRQLEFRWRQIWDSTGETELFTHMMPFYSYDVPHTCGPDPKVCCQFDFKRLPSFGLSCPWKIAPQPIDDNNVAKKADLIIDQWRKKSVLYQTRSVLIPLGDDFRYSQSSEWEVQFNNFDKLFNYINNEPGLHVEAKFSTLSEYFDSVRKEKELLDFPSLSGDFFTYADREDHYWSGYFTSRPYHKRLDRVLMHYLRSAEMLHGWSQWEDDAGMEKMLTEARRALSLFQHHDGVAGTAKDHVMEDYAQQMTEALKMCRFIMQQAVYKLLTKPSIYEPDYKYVYLNIDDSRPAGVDDTDRPTIIIGKELPSKYIVLHNSLPYEREELVEFIISHPYVKVTDFGDSIIQSQVTPLWSWHSGASNNVLAPQASNTKYRLLFRAKVPPMGLTVYTINWTASLASSTGTTFAKLKMLTRTSFPISLTNYPHEVEFAEPHEFSLRIDDGPGAAFNERGTLKAMSVDSNSETTPVHLEFLRYGTRDRGPDRSGAYLFLPNGPATKFAESDIIVLMTKGVLESSVATSFTFAVHETILRGGAVEIRNMVNIGHRDNTEITMRISTGIESKDIFYSDLNGMQMIKRQRFEKLPLQANFYPIPAAMFIEDDITRLTLLTAQPLGGASMESGQMEIMQDRRLNQDDNRGLGQGVLDNRPILNIFKLILERREHCSKQSIDYPGGFMTENTHTEMQALLYPMDKLVWHENNWNGVLPTFGSGRESVEKGIEVAVMRGLQHVKSSNKGKFTTSIGMVLHRAHLEECSTDNHREGFINIHKLLELDESVEIHNAHVTLLKKGQLITNEEINLCPMDLKGFIITR